MKQSIYQRLRMAFIFWLARRLPDCKTITPMLGESIDRKLSAREKLTMKLHLFTCEACQRYVKQIKFLREAVHVQEEKLMSDENSSPVKLSLDAKERMKDALKSSANFGF